MPTELMQSFTDDLKADRFVLTSLPEVAMNIKRVLESDEVCANDVAAVIARDPAIAAKLLKTANSVVFRGRHGCETVSASVSRMGFEHTRKLVTSFAVKDLFQSDHPVLRRAMEEAWQYSLTVGAIAHTLARRSGSFNPEEAMLAGILSNIGVLSVFNYAGNYPKLTEDETALKATVDLLKHDAGALVLDKWAFPADYLACALQCENWSRDTGRPADLCDLIIVATWHAKIGKVDIPRIDTLPAYLKTVSGYLTPEEAIGFLKEAREEVDGARALLAA